VVQVEEPPMDVAVALEHGPFFRPTTGVVAPYFGPNTAKLVGRMKPVGVHAARGRKAQAKQANYYGSGLMRTLR
jgi:hypothetical protein